MEPIPSAAPVWRTGGSGALQGLREAGRFGLPRAPRGAPLPPETDAAAHGAVAALLACGPLLRRRRRRGGDGAGQRHKVGWRLLVRRQNSAFDKVEKKAAKNETVRFKQAELWDQLWAEKDPYGDALVDQKDRAKLALGLQRLEDPQKLLEKKRITLLIADTGGGHRASARAVADALEELYPDEVSISIRDIWTECCPWPFNKVVQSYMWMAKKPWFWRIFFLTSKFPITRWFSQRFANVRCKRVFRHAIEMENPDVIVSLHPGTQHITVKCLRRLARRARRRIPFVTVVTDLGGAHPMWFHPEADRVFVPSENLRKLALQCGVREHSLYQYGLPLRRDFWNPEPRPKVLVREALDLDPKARTVLVIGGGDGVGKLQQVAIATGRELAERFGGPEAQIIVVCGKNEKARRSLKAYDWPSGLHVHVLGFVSNVHEWMSASDVIVTKAGPGTIAEACTRGLPVMLSAYLPGQEHGNVGYVVDGGFGDYNPKPDVIAATVCDWLADPRKLAEMSRQSMLHSRPSATRKIAEVIGKKWVRTGPEELIAALQQELASAGGASPSIKAAIEQLQEATDYRDEAELRLRDAKAKGRLALEEAQEAQAQPEPEPA